MKASPLPWSSASFFARMASSYLAFHSPTSRSLACWVSAWNSCTACLVCSSSSRVFLNSAFTIGSTSLPRSTKVFASAHFSGLPRNLSSGTQPIFEASPSKSSPEVAEAFSVVSIVSFIFSLPLGRFLLGNWLKDPVHVLVVDDPVLVRALDIQELSGVLAEDHMVPNPASGARLVLPCELADAYDRPSGLGHLRLRDGLFTKGNASSTFPVNRVLLDQQHPTPDFLQPRLRVDLDTGTHPRLPLARKSA